MATTQTPKIQPLYRVLIKSLSHPDGIEKLLCKRGDYPFWVGR